MLHVGKHFVYILVFLFLYILQSTPMPFFFSYGQPLWVLPAAIALAMLESDVSCAVYGAFAGMLCDIGSLLPFGFNGLLCCLCTCAVGILVTYLLRRNLLSFMLFSAIFLLLRGGLDYFFSFVIWRYDNAWKIFVLEILPVIFVTLLAAPLVFFLVGRLHRWFTVRLE